MQLQKDGQNTTSTPACSLTRKKLPDTCGSDTSVGSSRNIKAAENITSLLPRPKSFTTERAGQLIYVKERKSSKRISGYPLQRNCQEDATTRRARMDSLIL